MNQLYKNMRHAILGKSISLQPSQLFFFFLGFKKIFFLIPCTTIGIFTYFLFFSIYFESENYLPNCLYQTTEEKKYVACDNTEYQGWNSNLAVNS